MVRADVLRRAEELINGDRQETYGDASVLHRRIALMWGAYLGEDVSAKDVMAMMALLKIARTAGGAGAVDNWVDACGYAALAAEQEDCNG